MLGGGYFSPFQSAQYAQFLYVLSRLAFLDGNRELAEKSYYLNKMLHSVDWFYEVELPDIFFADHPLGSVLGRAVYSDRLVVSQGCTVGNNHGIYPSIGRNVALHPMSSVIGNSRIGNNVEISAYAFIRDAVIPDNCIVFGHSPDLIIKKETEHEMKTRLNQFVYEEEV